jgi:hypothetical protein
MMNGDNINIKNQSLSIKINLIVRFAYDLSYTSVNLFGMFTSRFRTINAHSRIEDKILHQNKRQAIYTGNTTHSNYNFLFPLCENGGVKRFQERGRTLAPKIHKE